MACGCDNNGWGGCGCGNTVQYAPSACNPNFPTTCTALGQGVIQRVVGEDSASCKYTVPPFYSNSLLSYNASTGLVNWADGSASNPIFLASGNQVSSSTVGAIQGTTPTPTGQLVAFKPTTSAETQFPIVSPSSSTTTWGTIEGIIPNQGIVYKTGSTSDGSLAANTVYQLTGTSGQYVSFDSLGNPVAVAPVLNQSYIAKSGNYQAVAGDRIAADTTRGAWVLTLPPAPATGTVVTVADANATWATNNLTVSPSSGSTIQGSVQNFIGNVSNWQVTFYFTGSTWVIIIT